MDSNTPGQPLALPEVTPAALEKLDATARAVLAITTPSLRGARWRAGWEECAGVPCVEVAQGGHTVVLLADKDLRQEIAQHIVATDPLQVLALVAEVRRIGTALDRARHDKAQAELAHEDAGSRARAAEKDVEALVEALATSQAQTAEALMDGAALLQSLRILHEAPESGGFDIAILSAPHPGAALLDAVAPFLEVARARLAGQSFEPIPREACERFLRAFGEETPPATYPPVGVATEAGQATCPRCGYSVPARATYSRVPEHPTIAAEPATQKQEEG